jgi:hypothetical protein
MSNPNISVSAEEKVVNFLVDFFCGKQGIRTLIALDEHAFQACATNRICLLSLKEPFLYLTEGAGIEPAKLLCPTL